MYRYTVLYVFLMLALHKTDVLLHLIVLFFQFITDEEIKVKLINEFLIHVALFKCMVLSLKILLTPAENMLICSLITKTRPCNIQRFLTTVKMTIFS